MSYLIHGFAFLHPLFKLNKEDWMLLLWSRRHQRCTFSIMVKCYQSLRFTRETRNEEVVQNIFFLLMLQLLRTMNRPQQELYMLETRTTEKTILLLSQQI